MVNGSRFTSSMTGFNSHVDVRRRYTHSSVAMKRNPENANMLNVSIPIANNIPIVVAA